MYTDKTKKPDNQKAKSSFIKKQSAETPVSLFTDNRPKAIAQLKLQEEINNNSRVKQLRAIQEMADNNSRAKQTARLQTVENRGRMHSIGLKGAEKKKESFHGKSAPVQKKQDASALSKTGSPGSLNSGMESFVNMDIADIKAQYPAAGSIGVVQRIIKHEGDTISNMQGLAISKTDAYDLYSDSKDPDKKKKLESQSDVYTFNEKGELTKEGAANTSDLEASTKLAKNKEDAEKKKLLDEVEKAKNKRQLEETWLTNNIGDMKSAVTSATWSGSSWKKHLGGEGGHQDDEAKPLDKKQDVIDTLNNMKVSNMGCKAGKNGGKDVTFRYSGLKSIVFNFKNGTIFIFHVGPGLGTG